MGPNDDLGIRKIVSQSIFCSANPERAYSRKRRVNVYRKVRESVSCFIVHFYFYFLYFFRRCFCEAHEIGLERDETLLSNQVEVRAPSMIL